MVGKICLITGANSGHGRAVAGALACRGATVVMACRDAGRAQIACDELRRATATDRISILLLDLSSQRSIRCAVDQFLTEHSALDVLVNNAGAWWADRRVSPDGTELVWATNVVGPYLLTKLLLPALHASATARIVNVSSSYAGGLDLNDVEFKRRSYSGIKAYQAAKQAVRMMTWSLAERLSGSSVVANAICPGFMKTNLGRNAPGGFRFMLFLTKPLQAIPKRGAETAVWLASSPEASTLTNQFFVKCSPAPCAFRDPAARTCLESLCEDAISGSVHPVQSFP
jgi:NAD(P)-dependent dehydrogenase (short-subunit alcohol dehydrogenase family)